MSSSHSINIHAFVTSGPDLGSILYPHRYLDGRYVVSMTRYEKDYIRVDDATQLLGWLEKGYRLRMSNPEIGITSPRLIEPEKVFRPVII